MEITPAQIRKLHQQLALAGLMDEKEHYVKQATNNRTGSSSEMTKDEARELISFLVEKNGQTAPPMYSTMAEQDSIRRMRGKILSYCHKMKWYKEGTEDNQKPDLDWKAINEFCVERGVGKKRLNQYTAEELPKLIYQFQKLHESYEKEQGLQA